ncbi:MAG: universal stress protein [Acidobacteriota bacterium]|nr:universal stress protein [Acidobacteriota bacterium]
MSAPSIQRILFPVDFSAACRGAARYVEAVAGRFESAIRLMHVVGSGERELAADLLPRRKAELDVFLSDELKQFTVERICEIGDGPEGPIENAAKNWPADLVMIPTHGLGVFRRVLLGSVTAKLLHDLTCPVWTSVHAETAPQLENIHCRNILCAVDLDARSKDVLQWANWFARENDAQLTIVHATPPIAALTPGADVTADFIETSYEIATETLAKLQKGLGLNCESIIRPGDPASVISSAAKAIHADILIFGRHHGHGLVDRLVENTFAILRRTPCPAISI